jgi:hypothetical protein
MSKPATKLQRPQGGTSTKEKSPEVLDSTHAACTMESKPARRYYISKHPAEKEQTPS